MLWAAPLGGILGEKLVGCACMEMSSAEVRNVLTARTNAEGCGGHGDALCYPRDTCKVRTKSVVTGEWLEGMEVIIGLFIR